MVSEKGGMRVAWGRAFSSPEKSVSVETTWFRRSMVMVRFLTACVLSRTTRCCVEIFFNEGEGARSRLWLRPIFLKIYMRRELQAESRC